jgi:hypothetical protein
VVGLAGCGGDGDGSGTDTPENTETGTETATPTEATTPTATETETATPTRTVDCPDDVFPGRPDDHSSDVTAAWCWFQERRIATTEDRTYLGWTEFDNDGTISVAQFDHDTGEFDVNRSIAETPRLAPDDHNSPSIYVGKDDDVQVWYTTHGRDDGNRYRTSTEPGDITDLGEERVLEDEDQSTYPMPFYLELRDQMFYFYRDSPPGRPSTFYFYMSSDSGETWGNRVQLFDITGGDYSGYIKVDVSADRIDICYSRHPRSASLGQCSIRHFYLDGATGHFKDSTGNPVSLPVTESAMTTVYDAIEAGRRGWIWDIQSVGSEPAIVFSSFPDGNEEPMRYHYAKYRDDAGEWKVTDVVGTRHLYATHISGAANELEYAPGINLGHDQGDDVIYLSRSALSPEDPEYDVDTDDMYRGLHLEKWRVGEDYQSAERERVVANGSESNQFRPCVPRSMRDERIESPINVVWMCCQEEAPYYYHDADNPITFKAEIETLDGRDVVELETWEYYSGCL